MLKHSYLAMGVAAAALLGLATSAHAAGIIDIDESAFQAGAGLITFSTELCGDYDQVSNWAPPPRYRQRPTIYRGAGAKLDHVRLQILAANSDRLLSEDRRPKSRDLNIRTERRKQVPV